MVGGFYDVASPWFWAAILPPLIFAITVHEVAHGWAAKQLGDPTASEAGRLTLNPIKHISLVGTIIVPVVMYLLIEIPFGWAKPVPVDFKRLNSPRRDLSLVAGAGPAHGGRPEASAPGRAVRSLRWDALPVPTWTGRCPLGSWAPS